MGAPTLETQMCLALNCVPTLTLMVTPHVWVVNSTSSLGGARGWPHQIDFHSQLVPRGNSWAFRVSY